MGVGGWGVAEEEGTGPERGGELLGLAGAVEELAGRLPRFLSFFGFFGLGLAPTPGKSACHAEVSPDEVAVAGAVKVAVTGAVEVAIAGTVDVAGTVEVEVDGADVYSRKGALGEQWDNTE